MVDARAGDQWDRFQVAMRKEVKKGEGEETSAGETAGVAAANSRRGGSRCRLDVIEERETQIGWIRNRKREVICVSGAKTFWFRFL